MIRGKWQVILVVLVTGTAAASGDGAARADRPPRPNIVFVLTDDLGWTDTSVRMMADRPDSRSDFFRTPHLERLARDGMVFSDAYAPAPVCSPTRDSILYGRTPARLHHAVLIGKASVPTGAMTIPQMLKAIDPDYVTAHFGKWGCTPTSPEAAGFDVSDGNTDNFHGDWRAVGDKRPLPEDDPKRIFSVTRRAGDFMAQQAAAGRPFYLRISHYAVHVGHQSLRQTRDKYRNLPRPSKAIDKDYEDPATFSENFFRDNWLSFKLMKNLNTGETRLFDLSADISESQDLSQQMPQKAEKLHARLTQYLDSVGAETIEENRRNRVEQLREFELRARKQIEELSEQLRAAGAQDRERLLRQIEQHQGAIQGHEAALERVEQGRTDRW